MANRYLAQQRAPIMAELDSKPWLQNWLAGVAEKELSGNHLPILESLVNRAEMTGKSLEQLTSQRMGFYGPVKSGDVSRYVNAGVPANVLDNTKAALDQIRAGSNVTQGATDQGKYTGIKSPWKIKVDGEGFGDMGDNPVSLARSSGFRTKQQAAAAGAGDEAPAQAAPPQTPAAPAAPAASQAPAPSAPPSPGIAATLAGLAGAAPIQGQPPPTNVFPLLGQPPPESQDAIDAATLNYWKAQQGQSFDNSDASYAGAY